MLNVRDFGAKGDGVTKDTAAIQKAIDAGGVVHFPAGIYLSGTLYLKSNGGLDLESGAVLLASPDPKDYNADDFCPQNWDCPSEHVSGAHLIVCVEQENVSLTGCGRIDGNRQAFYGLKDPLDCTTMNEVYPLHHCDNFMEEENWRPSQMIYFCESTEIKVLDLQLLNAPYWTCFFYGCEDVQVRGLRIANDLRTRNGDGLDIDCCRRVTVSDCIIDSGDDSIALRGDPAQLKKPRPCEYISISNCVLHSCTNGFRIGVGSGILRHIAISNIIVHHTRNAVSFTAKWLASVKEKGVLIEDFSFQNIRVDCQRAFYFGSSSRVYPDNPGCDANPIRRISVNGLYGRMARAIVLTGFSKERIEDISFSDLDLTIYPYLENDEGPFPTLAECHGCGLGPFTEAACYGEGPNPPEEQPPCAVLVRNARNVRFRDVRIHWETTAPVWRYGLISCKAENVRCFDCDFGKEDLVIS